MSTKLNVTIDGKTTLAKSQDHAETMLLHAGSDPARGRSYTDCKRVKFVYGGDHAITAKLDGATLGCADLA